MVYEKFGPQTERKTHFIWIWTLNTYFMVLNCFAVCCTYSFSLYILCNSVYKCAYFNTFFIGIKTILMYECNRLVWLMLKTDFQWKQSTAYQRINYIFSWDSVMFSYFLLSLPHSSRQMQYIILILHLHFSFVCCVMQQTYRSNLYSHIQHTLAISLKKIFILNIEVHCLLRS